MLASSPPRNVSALPPFSISEFTMTNTPLCADAPKQTKPVVSYLKLGEANSPYLEGWRCAACNAVFIGARHTCSRCFSSDLSAFRLSDSGRLYNWTIVHRNFPGIPVPFVSAIVDLDGGGTVKGNLVDIDPDPDNLQFDMPVKLVYRPIDATDAAGNRYISFFFVPA
jgi:uncharacterized protein